MASVNFGLLSFYPEEKRCNAMDKQATKNYVGLAKTAMQGLKALVAGELGAFDAAGVQDYQCQQRALEMVLVANSLSPEELEAQEKRFESAIAAIATVGVQAADGMVQMSASLRYAVALYFLAPQCEVIDFCRNKEDTGIARVFGRVEDHLGENISKNFAEMLRSRLSKEISVTTLASLQQVGEIDALECDGRMIPPFAPSVDLFLKKACKEKVALVLGVDFALTKQRVELAFRLGLQGDALTSEYLWLKAA